MMGNLHYELEVHRGISDSIIKVLDIKPLVPLFITSMTIVLPILVSGGNLRKDIERNIP